MGLLTKTGSITTITNSLKNEKDKKVIQYAI